MYDLDVNDVANAVRGFSLTKVNPSGGLSSYLTEMNVSGQYGTVEHPVLGYRSLRHHQTIVKDDFIYLIMGEHKTSRSSVYSMETVPAFTRMKISG